MRMSWMAPRLSMERNAVAQWRICYRWVDGDAHDVEIVDYH
jgi:plasmid maintenance system killer protein